MDVTLSGCWISPQATSKHPTHFSTSSYKKAQVRSCHCWSHWTSLATNQAAHRLQNSCSCSCFQIHSPPDTSIHIRHASRTVQCQTATLQFVIFTSFCWISHPVLNLCWQILFLLWSQNLESITGTYQMRWINRHFQETLETPSVWTCV